jgi:hypothetical protein
MIFAKFEHGGIIPQGHPAHLALTFIPASPTMTVSVMLRPTRPSHLFLALTFCLGCAALYPSLNMQGFLASGDHGRDLYAFEHTLHGETPYQDYWWVYGPLMPYYYALADHWLGVGIQSILLAKTLLTLAAGLLIYFTLETLAGGVTGFAGAAWFFAFQHDFFFTYNHAGGITGITFIMLCLAQYIRRRNCDWLWPGLVGAFILSLIKLNFGAAGIAMILITALITDQVRGIAFTREKLKLYIFGGAALPLIIAGVYASFLRGLSWAEIAQCLPFGRTDSVYHTNPLQALALFFNVFWQNCLSHPTDFILFLIVLIALLRILHTFNRATLTRNNYRETLLILVLFGLYYVFNLHEYLRGGLWYRTFWAQPAGIVWMFAVIHLALKNYPGIVRIGTFGLLTILSILQINTTATLLRRTQVPAHFLAERHDGVFLSNTPEWIKTVQDTTAFLKKNVPADQTFFAAPYDPLYYYLTARRSPTRMLIFFDHIHLSPEQEQKIIRELETAKVNFVVLSNRIKSSEEGLGVFGQTYGRAIAQYINANFTPEVQFGDWQNEPGWAWNYGTLILKRKVFLK